MNNFALLLLMPAAIVLLGFSLRSLRALTALSALASWIQLALTAYLVAPALQANELIIISSSGLAIDKVSAWFLLLTALVMASTLSHAHFFFAREMTGKNPPPQSDISQFYVLSALFSVAMMAVYLCNNLGFLWISIEMTTLCTAGLVYFSRTKHSLEATWKYFIVCSVGIAFALLGTILIFAASQFAIPQGTLAIDQLIKLSPQLNLTLFKLGFIFCFLGYGTKAGIFPLHSWLPDAHSEAPAPASAMLSGALLNCALFAIWRLCEISAASRNFELSSNLAIWVGALTVVAASLFLVRQHGLKRLWAYSSVENVGLMLIAIGLYSPVLFFIQAANHSLAKVSLFLLSGNIVQATGSKNLKDMRGIFNSAPSWGILMALSALAVMGVPPFGSFISEWMILSRSIEQSRFIPCFLMIVGLALSFIAVSMHIGAILLGTPKSKFKSFKPLASSVIPAVLVCVSFVFGITFGPNSFWGILK